MHYLKIDVDYSEEKTENLKNMGGGSTFIRRQSKHSRWESVTPNINYIECASQVRGGDFSDMQTCDFWGWHIYWVAKLGFTLRLLWHIIFQVLYLPPRYTEVRWYQNFYLIQ